MAINFPGPYELRIIYQTVFNTQPVDHTQRLNVKLSGTPNPGDPFSAIDVLLRNTFTATLSSVATDWATVIKPFLHSSSSILYAELWKIEPLSFDASFVSTFDLAIVGTSAVATQAAGQAIWSFRTIEGGVMKVNIMEPTIGIAQRRVYTSMSAAEKAVADFVTASDAPFLARDTSYPFAPIALYPGQNEALFKRRFRLI